jgi:hypothetical protein
MVDKSLKKKINGGLVVDTMERRNGGQIVETIEERNVV